MKKIIFCVTTLSKGGAERVICNLANYFSIQQDYDVSIVAINKSKIEYDLNDNVKVYFANDLSKKGRFRNIFIRNFNFRKLVNTICPDIVVSFLPVAVFISLLHKHNYKVVISVRNDPKIEYGTLKNKILSKILFPKADSIIFQTNDAMNYFNNIHIKKKKIIYNSVSTNFLNKVYSEKRDKRIVTVGRLEKQKNHILLINAFKKFQEIHDDYILEIYGEGSMRNELEGMIKLHNLSDKVFLCGQIDDVVKAIRKAAMFVLSSDYEGMPNALVEAMVLGIPCISTDCPCGGPKSLIVNEINGLLVPVGDIDSLVNAMSFLVNNPEKCKLIEKESIKILSKVDENVVYKQWFDVVEEILKIRE